MRLSLPQADSMRSRAVPSLLAVRFNGDRDLSLLQPLPTEAMISLAASPLVNSVRNDDRGLLVPDALAA